MNKVLFEVEENILVISIGKTKQSFDLNDPKINNDEFASFLTDLSSYFIAEDFIYEVKPEEAKNQDKIKLFIELIDEFIKSFKEEFNNLKQKYHQEIKNLKTKIND